jgi:lipid A disaccharide synthetase
LIAERKIVPELMQNQMTASRLADEAGQLLSDPARRAEMRRGLAEVSALLRGPANSDAIRRAAEEIWNLEGERIGFVS